MATKQSIKKRNKYFHTPYAGETQPKETKVIPKEAMTVREMLIKNANGTMYDNVLKPYYEEQAKFSTLSLSELQNMDEFEKFEYLQEISDKANALKQSVQQSIEDAQKQQDANKVVNSEEEVTTSTDLND